jgi:hypothetical protein
MATLIGLTLTQLGRLDLFGLFVANSACCTPHQLIHLHRSNDIQPRKVAIVIQEAGRL